MKTKISFDKTQTDLEVKSVEQESQGKILVEIQNHFDGDFLVFADEPPPRSIEERLAALEVIVAGLAKGKV